MESENFFGFDTAIPPDDDEGNGDFEDGEYDALNDETFGSAAVGGDWEKSHEQLSSLTEAERRRMAAGKNIKNLGSRHIDIDYKLDELHSKQEFQKTLENLSLGNSLDKKRLYERSIASSPLIDASCEISSSPGSSIWSPTLGLHPSNTNQIKKPINSRPDNALNSPLFNNSQQYNHLSVQKSLSDLNLGFQISSVKTVSEIEEELRRQHSNNHQNAARFTNLEQELVRQLNLKKAGNLQNLHSYHNIRGTMPPNVQSLISHQLMNNQTNHPLHGHFHNTTGNLKPFGNLPHHLQSTHPLLSNFQNKTLPAGLGNVSNIAALRHPFLQQMNQRNQHLKGIFPNGSNMVRKNLNRNMDKKPFDQNNRYDQLRSNQDQRDKLNQNDGRVRRDSDTEWEEWMRIRQEDEYAGLMTPKEKGWLRNIQAMQLQTNNPYQDDYYYVMFSVKQQRKREEEVVSLDGLQYLHDKREGKEYEPPRLENSLGKLQVASVNAPRKIIDLQVIHLDSSHPTTLLQRDMRKHRHLLFHIEKLYNTQIELDDLERKIRALPDCPTRDLFRSKCRQLVGKLWTGLISPHESFVQLLCVRKGKTLTARLLSWVSPTEVEHVLATVIQNLTLISKKDTYDKRLPLFWPYADRFFNISPFSTIVSFGLMMEPQLKDQKKQSVPAFSSELGLSIVLSLLVRGEEHFSNLDKDENWQKFLKAVATALSSLEFKNDSIIKPLPSVTLAASSRLLTNHLSRCENMEPTVSKRAFEVLKTYEDYLTKHVPSYLTSSSSSSSFTPSSNSKVPESIGYDSILEFKKTNQYIPSNIKI